MKLYATVTSERATKGQGGNDFIEIEVKNANQFTFLQLRIKESPHGDAVIVDGWVIQETEKRGEQYFKYEAIKGKRQKGDKCLNGCVMFYNGYCDKCGHKK